MNSLDDVRKRVIKIISLIYGSHPHIKSDRDLSKFFLKNKIKVSYITISKWRRGENFPTVQHIHFLCERFKDYGANGNYIISGIEKEKDDLLSEMRKIIREELSVKKGNQKGKLASKKRVPNRI